MAESGSSALRSVQTFFEFIVAGTLILASLYGLLWVVDHHAAKAWVHTMETTAGAIGVGSVLFVSAVYGVGVLIDDLTRIVLEERPLNRIKTVRLSAFEQRHPGFFEQVIGLDVTLTESLTELQKFGVMRMYVLLHGEQLYAEVTNQLARLRLGRVIFASLVITLLVVGILAVRTGSILVISGSFTTACLVFGAFRGMIARFDRYVRSVERAFFVLGASQQPSKIGGA
jgi:hypothetical protein